MFAFFSLLLLSTPTLSSTFCYPSDWSRATSKGDAIYSPTWPSEGWAMPYLGNGFIGFLVGSDTLYIGGVFNGNYRRVASPIPGNLTGDASHPPSHRARLPSPDFNITAITPLLAPCGTLLDIRHGLLIRRWLSPGGAKIEEKWYASRDIPSFLVHELTLYDGASVQIVDTPGEPTTDFDLHAVEGSPRCLQGHTLVTEEPNVPAVEVAMCSNPLPSTLTSSGTSVSARRSTAVATSLESKNPLDSATEAWAKWSSSPDLLPNHEAAWEALWEEGSIEVVGDGVWQYKLSTAVNASLYYILSSIRHDWPYGLSPGGLCSNAYNGHTFWDQDTWMQPVITMLHPSLSASLLRYRADRLPAARVRASQAGYEGTMWPWESAVTGLDATPPPNPEGHIEQHIIGDIAMAARLHWFLTGDVAWLKESGWPLAQGAAEFWASRVVKRNNEYIINGVQPPDEAAGKVNNSAYTNAIAAASLLFGAEAAKIVGAKNVPVDRWRFIATHMYIPFDPVRNIHLEFDGYENDGRLINQADVALMQYPLAMNMSRQVAYNDLSFWESVTDPNGYFTGDSAYVAAWLALGEEDRAASEFNKTEGHFEPPFLVWREKLSGGHKNFITGAGGFLQAMAYGYSGIRLQASQLKLEPHLPEGVSGLGIRGIHFLGSSLHVKWDSDRVTASLLAATKDAPLLYLEPGHLKIGRDTVSVQLPLAVIHP